MKGVWRALTGWGAQTKPRPSSEGRGVCKAPSKLEKVIDGEAMPEFVLNVQDIDEAGKSFDFPVTRSWLVSVLGDTEVRPGDDVDGELTLRAHKQGVDVVLDGRVKAALVADCARCLEDTRIDVDSRFAALLSARTSEVRPEPGEVELTPEDLERHYYNGEQIVLDEAVREHLLLEVPMQLLCDETCTGIDVPSEVSGPADLNAKSNGENGVDPRLAPLMKLVDKVSTEES